jgi:hypothetical protein
MNQTENMAETFTKTKFKPALKRSATGGGTRASNSKRPVSKLIVQKSTEMNPMKDPDSPKASQVDNDKYKVWYDEYQAKIKVVDSLINEDDDLFAALDILHPHLHELILTQTKKLQRKIDTQELK